MCHGDLSVATQREMVRAFSTLQSHDPIQQLSPHLPIPLVSALFCCCCCQTTWIPFFIVATGDLYGGAHYLQSSSADMTPQGRAIQEASIRFGNGQTLPFTPCKKGFVPHVAGQRRYACPLHNRARQKRVLAANGRFRPGELNLETLWQRYEQDDDDSPPINKQEGDDDAPTSTSSSNGKGSTPSKEGLQPTVIDNTQSATKEKA